MILFIATSSFTRGGITSVINEYKKNNEFWLGNNCKWIATHIDKNLLYKSVYFLSAIIKFILYIPSSKVVHIHLSGPISTKRKWIFIKIAKFFRKPIIIHFHAFSEKASIDPNHKTLYKKTFDSANKIIVLSNSWKTGLTNDLKIHSNKIEVIYNPCSTISCNKNILKEKIILYAGTLNERKNYKTLIEAFSKIQSKNKGWKLVFAGNGEIEKAKKIVNDFKLNGSVDFLGWVNNEDKYEIFSKTSIFCLPSYAEGFPMAVLDAWSYGLPVITTPVGGIPDVAIDMENMILFNPCDVNELAIKLDLLLNDYKLQSKLSKKAFEFSKNEFNIASIKNKLNIIYKNLLLTE